MNMLYKTPAPVPTRRRLLPIFNTICNICTTLWTVKPSEAILPLLAVDLAFIGPSDAIQNAGNTKKKYLLI